MSYLSSETGRTLEAARRNYAGFPNVCGISFGSKYSGGRRLDGISAVQFFVTHKVPPTELSRQLPRYVFQRGADGTPQRDQQIPTDVIELANLKLCCCSGDGIGNEMGVKGSVTIIFSDPVAPPRTLLITCSHVAGDLSGRDRLFDLSGGTDPCFFEATTVAFTRLEAGMLTYDVAVAEVTGIGDFHPLAVRGLNQVFTRFADAEDLAPHRKLDCQSRVSGRRSLSLESHATELRGIQTGEFGEIAVSNIFACRGVAIEGDSGGIVFAGDCAVGIIVASADDNWVFIHLLKDAIAHLEAVSGIPLRVF